MESKPDRPEEGSIPGGWVGGLRKPPTRGSVLSQPAKLDALSPSSETRVMPQDEVDRLINAELTALAIKYLERNDRL